MTPERLAEIGRTYGALDRSATMDVEDAILDLLAYVDELQRRNADAVREAVLAEREACAVLVETCEIEAHGVKMAPTQTGMARAIRRRSDHVPPLPPA